MEVYVPTARIGDLGFVYCVLKRASHVKVGDVILFGTLSNEKSGQVTSSKMVWLAVTKINVRSDKELRFVCANHHTTTAHPTSWVLTFDLAGTQQAESEARAEQASINSGREVGSFVVTTTMHDEPLPSSFSAETTD